MSPRNVRTCTEEVMRQRVTVMWRMTDVTEYTSRFLGISPWTTPDCIYGPLVIVWRELLPGITLFHYSLLTWSCFWFELHSREYSNFNRLKFSYLLFIYQLAECSLNHLNTILHIKQDVPTKMVECKRYHIEKNLLLLRSENRSLWINYLY